MRVFDIMLAIIYPSLKKKDSNKMLNLNQINNQYLDLKKNQNSYLATLKRITLNAK